MTTLLGSTVQNQKGGQFRVTRISWEDSADGPVPCVELSQPFGAGLVSVSVATFQAQFSLVDAAMAAPVVVEREARSVFYYQTTSGKTHQAHEDSSGQVWTVCGLGNNRKRNRPDRITGTCPAHAITCKRCRG